MTTPNEDALPNWARACKTTFLLQPSSAASERAFSILSVFQRPSLQDYIEASVMLQYNSHHYILYMPTLLLFQEILWKALQVHSFSSIVPYTLFWLTIPVPCVFSPILSLSCYNHVLLQASISTIFPISFCSNFPSNIEIS